MTARSYCFTINNYTDDELKCVRGLVDSFNSAFRYVVFGIEKGDSGTPHLQGYLELLTPQKMSFLKKHGFARAHLEKRRGGRKEARAYCMKDGQFEEFGSFAAGGQGSRNDLRTLRDFIYAGATWKQVNEEFPEICRGSMKWVQKCFEIAAEELARPFREVNVCALIGDAGTGKSRYAIEAFPDIFVVDSKLAFPFDGYAGQKAILIDEFYGGLPYSTFLNTLDGHRQRVNVKGGHTYARWEFVFITSNLHPSQWYKAGLTPALKRRLNVVLELTKIVDEPEQIVISDQDLEKADEWFQDAKITVPVEIPVIAEDSATSHNVVGNTTETAEAIPLPPQKVKIPTVARNRAFAKYMKSLIVKTGLSNGGELVCENDFASNELRAPRVFHSSDRPFDRDDFATYH